MKFLKSVFTKKYLRVWVWLIGFTLFNIIRVRLTGKRVRLTEKGDRIAGKICSFSPTFYFLLFCLIWPIVEEFIYRYLIFNIFGKEGKKFWLSCFISFFTFIFSHQQAWNNFNRFYVLALYSFSLIFIYWLSDWNLFFPIVLHDLFNTTVAVFYICQQ